MKAKIKTILIYVVLSGALAACGSMKVGLDDETIAAAECLVQDQCDDTSSTDSADSGTDTADNSGDNTNSGGDGFDSESGSGAGIPGGTIAILSDGHKGSGRYFMGTYKLQPYSSTCTISYAGSVSYPGFVAYDLPANVRAYSYGNRIDFENSQGGLVWIADIYSDETFDFSIQYRHDADHPGASLDCSCVVSNSFDNIQELVCTCEPTDDTGHCKVEYDNISS